RARGHARGRAANERAIDSRTQLCLLSVSLELRLNQHCNSKSWRRSAGLCPNVQRRAVGESASSGMRQGVGWFAGGEGKGFAREALRPRGKETRRRRGGQVRR